jgi:hypothetical protein
MAIKFKPSPASKFLTHSAVVFHASKAIKQTHFEGGEYHANQDTQEWRQSFTPGSGGCLEE